jgi:hypothetical protein
MHKMNIAIEAIRKLNGLGDGPFVLGCEVNRYQYVIQFVWHRYTLIGYCSIWLKPGLAKVSYASSSKGSKFLSLILFLAIFSNSSSVVQKATPIPA